MEEQVNRLVQKTWAKYQTTPASERLLIAVSGIPGSGKTTLAATVVSRLKALSAEDSESAQIAACIPMDGYHYSRAALDRFPDPTEAHRRRGAEFTFDGASFLTLVQKLRLPLSVGSTIVSAPSFSHALKDPVEDDIPIHPSHRILVFEGLYLSLDKAPWREAAGLMDELWFVDVDKETAARRLIPRHIKAGIAKDEKEAGERAWTSDLVNGDQIINGRLKEGITEIIVSREDDRWKED